MIKKIILTVVLVLASVGIYFQFFNAAYGDSNSRYIANSEQTRKLPLDGANNFRDLGGYQTVDGQTVKWGLIYRADKLTNLSDADLQYLQRIKLKQVIDFRSDEERNDEPDRIPQNVVLTKMSIPVANKQRNLIRRQIKDGVIDPKLKDFLIDANQRFVSQYTPVFKQWIHDLVNEEKVPQVFHCTAGKDRTGFAAAMLLLALGVDKTTVMQDYLKTNVYTNDYINNTIRLVEWSSFGQIEGELLRPLLGVEKRFLQAAFNQIDKEYGSIENYLINGLGIDDGLRIQLKHKFLY